MPELITMGLQPLKKHEKSISNKLRRGSENAAFSKKYNKSVTNGRAIK
jgi:hypothetical protein